MLDVCTLSSLLSNEQRLFLSKMICVFTFTIVLCVSYFCCISLSTHYTFNSRLNFNMTSYCGYNQHFLDLQWSCISFSCDMVSEMSSCFSHSFPISTGVFVLLLIHRKHWHVFGSDPCQFCACQISSSNLFTCIFSFLQSPFIKISVKFCQFPFYQLFLVYSTMLHLVLRNSSQLQNKEIYFLILPPGS